jgi:hypothetical protein
MLVASESGGEMRGVARTELNCCASCRIRIGRIHRRERTQSDERGNAVVIGVPYGITIGVPLPDSEAATMSMDAIAPGRRATAATATAVLISCGTLRDVFSCLSDGVNSRRST